VILLGLVTSLHGFDVGLRELKWWLLPASYAMTLAGVYFTLKCLLWINAISGRRATIAGASSTLAITLLYVAHQGILTILLISLLLLITALALRGGLNYFRLRWVRVGLGDALLLSVVTLPVLVGGAILIALLVMVVAGFYTYNDQLAKSLRSQAAFNNIREVIAQLVIPTTPSPKRSSPWSSGSLDVNIVTPHSALTSPCNELAGSTL